MGFSGVDGGQLWGLWGGFVGGFCECGWFRELGGGEVYGVSSCGH